MHVSLLGHIVPKDACHAFGCFDVMFSVWMVSLQGVPEAVVWLRVVKDRIFAGDVRDGFMVLKYRASENALHGKHSIRETSAIRLRVMWPSP